MGLFDEIRKLTQPYDEDDEEFFAEEAESGAGATVLAGRRGFGAAVRPGADREDNPFADATRPLNRGDFYESQSGGAGAGADRPNRDFSRQFDIPTDAGSYGGDRPVSIHPAVAMQVVMAKPERFDQAAEIAEQLRQQRVVVVNLENANRDVARRLVDFLSGVAYANGGKIQKAAVNTYVILPFRVEILGDLADELENSGIRLY